MKRDQEGTVVVVHQRIHRANDLAWCGIRFVYGRKRPLTNVVTISERVSDLLTVQRIEKNGQMQIDYTPRTPEEKAEIQAEYARLNVETTCKSCRKARGYK